MKMIDVSEYLDSKKNIIIALSGGADSVCLTHQFWQKKKFNIILAHFNHNLRGKESNQDEKFCREFAEKLDLKIEIGKWEKPQKSEAKTREARYKFLRKIQEKHNAQAICLGHHLDDQVETILFNFLRGTGLRGLSGMSIFENELLRPLLKITKKEVLEYCKKNKLKYCTDKTNFDTTYSRNLLRLNILPELQKINPNLAKTLLQNAENYQDIADCLKQQVEPFVNKDKIKVQDFLNLDQALQTELIRQKIGNFTEPSSKKIAEILRIIQGGKGNKFKEFDGIKVSVNRGVVLFEMKT